MPLAQSHPWQPVPVKHEESDATEVREYVVMYCLNIFGQLGVTEIVGG